MRVVDAQSPTSPSVKSQSNLLQEATPTPANLQIPREREYRLPGYFLRRTYTEGCEIRERLLQHAIEDDESAEYHYRVASQYRAREEENRRRVADLDRILAPGP